ncbi:MAG: phosphatidate cytidylyltransferase, partial [Pseudomonadota bacterium]
MADVEDLLPEVPERVRDPKAGVSDLPVRLASAVVMVGVAGAALWLGGFAWIGFVIAVAGLVLWEWNRLARAMEVSPLGEVVWLFFGALYVTGAALAMI